MNIPEFNVPIQKFVDSIKIDFIKSNDYQIRYTTNGAIPDLKSALFVNHIFIKKSAELKATAFSMDGKALNTSTLKVEQIPGLESKIKLDKTFKQGLKRVEYKADFHLLADFAKAEKTNETIQPDLIIDTTAVRNNFGYIFEGYINIEKAGMYEFYAVSDDGAKLIIDDYEVVVNDGCHAAQSVKGLVGIGKGLHSIKLYYFDNIGGQSLLLEWKGQDFQRRKVEKEILFTK